jgi:hypothetical protein
MAAITASNVTVLEVSEEGTKSSKGRGIILRCAVVLSAQGATLGDLPASAFGMSEIFWAWCFGFNNGGNNNQCSVTVDATVTSPGVNNTNILTYSSGSATPANLTGTILLEIFGRSL